MILTTAMADPTWTQADIDKLKIAISSGVLMVTYAGPPQRSVQYQSLAAMRALLAEMVGQVNGSPRFTRVSFNKGFDPSSGNEGSGNGGCW
jgi:hypothetical protein